MVRFWRYLAYYLRFGDHPDPWDGPPGKAYISDKVATLAYLNNSPHFNSRQVELLAPLIGTMVSVEIDGKTYTINGDDVYPPGQTKVVRRGKNWLSGVTENDKLWGRNLRWRLIDDGDGYWTCSSFPIPHFRERFRELSPAEHAEVMANLARDAEGRPIVTPYSNEAKANAREAGRLMARKVKIEFALHLLLPAVLAFLFFKAAWPQNGPDFSPSTLPMHDPFPETLETHSSNDSLFSKTEQRRILALVDPNAELPPLLDGDRLLGAAASLSRREPGSKRKPSNPASRRFPSPVLARFTSARGQSASSISVGRATNSVR